MNIKAEYFKWAVHGKLSRFYEFLQFQIPGVSYELSNTFFLYHTNEMKSKIRKQLPKYIRKSLEMEEK